MSFISISFALFFTILAVLYFSLQRFQIRDNLVQQILLFAASIVFYSLADLRFVPFLLYVIVLTYFAGLLCKNRLSLVLFLLADFAPLLSCKYGPHFLHAHWIFPLGLSFFTFQSAGYIADVHKKKITPEKNPLTVALFVSFFPVISSGPIQRAGNLIPQLKIPHRFDYDMATDGMKLFAWGMFKKIVIADRIAVYVNFVYGNAAEQHGLALLLATVLYSFQIYCDFSGYSDMAIGTARFFGFDAGKNFDHPYLSESVGEFWRRWHISLSSWLRDYVYIPLGGSRVALPRIYLNLMITFLVSGIWHGSTWNFVIWGALHGLYQCVGRAAKPLSEKLRIPAAIRIFFTFCLVTFAWIFFRAETLQEAAIILGKLAEIPSEIARLFPLSLRLDEDWRMLFKEFFALTSSEFGYLKSMVKLLALIFCFLLVSFCTRKTGGLKIMKRQKFLVRWLAYFLLLFTIYFTILRGENTAYSTDFIYQNF